MKGMGCVATIVVLVLFGALALVWGGVAVGAANAWIMQGTFWDAWHAWWDRWPIALGWMILFMGLLGGTSSASTSSK